MINIITGDCRTVLSWDLDDDAFDTCVTSPPYYRLRDYGYDDQLGRGVSIEDYVKDLVDIMAGVKMRLKATGSLWLVLGDTYKDKQLLGIPWRVAFALQQDGWLLRSAVIWQKPNVKPDGAKDRPTNEYEHVFLLTVNKSYYYNQAAIKENPADYTRKGGTAPYLANGMNADGMNSTSFHQMSKDGRNKRNVWSISTVPAAFPGHFAAFPPKLAEICIKATCPPGGAVLDPFGGTGTTGLVAARLGLDATLIEINSKYAQAARDRITMDAPLFASVKGETND